MAHKYEDGVLRAWETFPVSSLIFGLYEISHKTLFARGNCISCVLHFAIYCINQGV